MHISTCALNTTSSNHLIKHQEKNCTFLSGLAISGNILQKGFMTSRNLTENEKTTLLATVKFSSSYFIYTTLNLINELKTMK